MAKTSVKTAKKAPTKKSTLKKTATKKAPLKQKENNVFNWTDELRQNAHDELLKKYNRIEPTRKTTLLVNYREDGTATTKGVAKQMHSHKM